MTGSRLLFALDLVDDPKLIDQYEEYHRRGNVWPEVLNDIREQGISSMEIWRTGNRLVMIAEVEETSVRSREEDPKIALWEELMWKFQNALPHAKPGEKWVPMNKIFDLAEHEPGE